MAGLLAGLPESVPAITVNRLCASGLDAVGSAARALKQVRQNLFWLVVSSQSAVTPFVQPKPASCF